MNTVMNRCTLTIVLVTAFLLGVAVAQGAFPLTQNWSGSGTTSERGSVDHSATSLTASAAGPWKRKPRGTIVLGDSITYHSKDELKKLHPRWRVNAERGRNVRTLPWLVRKFVRYHGHPPKRLIVALGSNANREWSKQDYKDAIAPLPESTSVFFVTVFRDHERKDKTMAQYSRWMRQIVAERPNTWKVDWRWRIKRNTHLLTDDVHPNQRGQRIWAKKISRVVRRAHAEIC